jgi:HNH endonuclease
MRWRRVSKENTTQPKSGEYSDWKHILAEEGFHQCVYCALHDATFGERNFHVEHYKPKSNYRFKHLVNDIRNLFYACPICNVFKGNSWPRAPKKDHSVEAFPNPSTCDYSDLFGIDRGTKEIRGKFIASKYLITRLHLNRAQLITERRIFYADETKSELVKISRSLFSQLREKAEQGDKKASAYCDRLYKLVCELDEINSNYRRTPTYASEQMR